MMIDSRTQPPADGQVIKPAASVQQKLKSAPYPRYSLREAEKLARAAFNIGPRHCDQERVAKAVGYTGVNNGTFRRLRASANYFGFITTQKDEYLSVTEPWIEVFHSEDTEQLRQALRGALQQPELYRRLLEEYGGHQLPSADKLARDLYVKEHYGILKDAADTAVRAFLESAEYAGMIDSRGFLRTGEDAEQAVSIPGSTNRGDQESGVPTLGTHLHANREFSKPSQVQDIDNVGGETIVVPKGLDRIEVQLRNSKKAYLFVPVPLPTGEKERLKGYIDLILEESIISVPQEHTGGAGATRNLGQQEKAK
jgi:hypothetical protein